MKLPPTTLTNMLEMIEHQAKRIEDDCKRYYDACDPWDRLDRNRTIAWRYRDVAREIGHVAKLLRDGVGHVAYGIFNAPRPQVIRMQDGAVFVEFGWMIETFRLLVDLSPVKAELMMFDERVDPYAIHPRPPHVAQGTPTPPKTPGPA